MAQIRVPDELHEELKKISKDSGYAMAFWIKLGFDHIFKNWKEIKKSLDSYT